MNPVMMVVASSNCHGWCVQRTSRGDPVVVHLMACQGAELEERAAGIDQGINAFSREQLVACLVAGHCLLATTCAVHTTTNKHTHTTATRSNVLYFTCHLHIFITTLPWWTLAVNCLRSVMSAFMRASLALKSSEFVATAPSSTLPNCALDRLCARLPLVCQRCGST